MSDVQTAVLIAVKECCTDIRGGPGENQRIIRFPNANEETIGRLTLAVDKVR